MTIRHKFEPNAGYRFFKNDVSLLLHAAVQFKQSAIVTSAEMFELFKRLNSFLVTVGVYEREHQGISELITVEQFPNFTDAEFYKYLPEQSLEYYKDGSFQFGSIQYYRTIENQKSKDAMEGLSNMAIKTPQHLFGVSLVSGYNFGIFCGVPNLENRRDMSKRFGHHIIRIADLKVFAEKVQSLLGAKRFYFNRVVYNDLKMFRVKTLKSIQLSKTNPPTDFNPQLIDDAVFDLLYENSFLPSLFMKPTRFSIDNELRLVFEMSGDVPPPDVIRKTDKSLLRYIEFIQ